MRRTRPWIATLTVLSACSCWLGEPSLSPEARIAQLSIVASASGPLAVGVADVQSVRVVVRRLDGTVVVDDASPATATDAEVLERSFPVEFTPPSEVFTVEVSLLDSSGRVVFMGGPVQVTLGEGAQAGTLDIEPIYVGVGAEAESVRLVPTSATVGVGESFTFVAEALGPSQNVIEGTPARWTSGDAAVASLVDVGRGEVRALQPGTVEITARLLTGPTATATLTVVPNQSAVANAGPDQTVVDVDLSGSEAVTLDGSGSSDPDGTIVSYEWTEGTTVLGTGVSITRDLTVGPHTITLTVTDDRGLRASDQTSVTVVPGNQPPVADAGPDQTVTDEDLSGAEPVTLDGSGSRDPDGTIATYEWVGDAIIVRVDTIVVGIDTTLFVSTDTISSTLGSGPTITPDLSVGTHVITLTVTDDKGLSSSDEVEVIVARGTAPSVTLTVDRASLAENGSDSPATVTATLSRTSSQTVTVGLGFGGTATPTGQLADYTRSGTQITIPVGSTTGSVTIAAVSDGIDEPNETVIVDITGVTNANEDGVQQVTVAIVDDDPAPSLSINDVAVTEGNSGTVNAVFTVTLSAASAQPVTVNYATANGTATAGSDYSATSGVLTFVPGDVSESVTVAVMGDLIDEPPETFTVNLSGPSNATVGDGTGVGTITDNDAAPSLSINDATVVEGNAGTVNAVFTVTLSAASGQTVTVNFATANGTATAGSDYVASSGQLTFTPGDVSESVTVAVIGDLIDEPPETFTVNLSSPSNATIGDATGVGTITDNDAAPSLSINDVTVVEGNAGTVNAVFTVTLSAASAQTVTVNFAAANGTATAGSDYNATSGVLTFVPGDVSESVTVAVIGDLIAEPPETFTVNLSGPSNATIGDGTGVGTITDNDPAPALSINDVTVVEGNAGTVNAVFMVTLSSASGQTVTVNFATANGTATAGSDYNATSGVLTFVPGDVSEGVTVAVIGDLIDELPETFTVNLSGPSNATVSDGTGVGTITDNDPAPSLSINNVTAPEGDAGVQPMQFAVTLSAASAQTVTVSYATANGTATAGSDYTSTSGVLTFAPGDVSETVNVFVAGDTIVELDETYTVNLSGPSNATIFDGIGVGTITNDDVAPGPPSISNFNHAWTFGSCGIANTHSIQYTVSFTDPDGDNGDGITRVWVQINAQTPYESDDIYNSYTGTGFNGTMTAHNCLTPNGATISIWIEDGLGNLSNTLSKLVPPSPF